MPKKMLFSGKTVEEAVARGLKSTGLDRSQVEVKVISATKKKFFGRTIPAIVELVVKTTPSDKPLEDHTLDGLVWIENGQIQYVPAKPGGKPPVIMFSDLVTVKYKGVEYKYRLELDQGLDGLEIILPSEQKPHVQIDIAVSPDKMKAFLSVLSLNGCHYTLMDQPPSRVLELKLSKETQLAPTIKPEQILDKLNAEGIVYGILHDQIENGIRTNYQQILIAQGDQPVLPQDGRIEYLFEDSQAVVPDDTADQIDYYELKPINTVEAGQVIARLVPGTPGKDGINVYGQRVTVPAPKEAKWVVGEGVQISDDERFALASRSGLPVVQKGILKVLNIYELQSDANVQTGNIRFNGEIIIRGNVCDNVLVQATGGGVRIYGMVDHAEVQSERDVIAQNVISARIIAGGITAVYTRLATYLHQLATMLVNLEASFNIVYSHSASIHPGTLIKNLIDIKFRKLPELINEFAESFKAELSLLEPDFHTLMFNLKDRLVDRGPLSIDHISVVREYIEEVKYWQHRFEKYAEDIANVTISYVQNSEIEASGVVRIIGKGLYYSSITAGKGYYQEQGVFRGSHVTVRSGDIRIREMGSATGIQASASITNQGKITVGVVYPNVTVAIKNQKYQFLTSASNVRVFWSDDGIEVYSGNRKLT